MMKQYHNTEREINQLVIDRCSFFAARVETYAVAVGLTNREVVEHLVALGQVYGEKAITGIIDRKVPAHLHSTKMPL